MKATARCAVRSSQRDDPTNGSSGASPHQEIPGVVELVVRPTGLIDPKVSIKPLKGQIDDLMEEVRKRGDEERAHARTPRLADQAHLAEEG